MENLTFEIYSRWGDKLFSTNTNMKCWDGNVRGKPLPPGVYIYQIAGSSICGEVRKKGTITLIR